MGLLVIERVICVRENIYITCFCGLVATYSLPSPSEQSAQAWPLYHRNCLHCREYELRSSVHATLAGMLSFVSGERAPDHYVLAGTTSLVVDGRRTPEYDG